MNGNKHVNVLHTFKYFRLTMKLQPGGYIIHYALFQIFYKDSIIMDTAKYIIYPCIVFKRRLGKIFIHGWGG